MSPYPSRLSRAILSVGLLALAFAAQIGPAKAQDGLAGFFSQFFAPAPQPSYVQPSYVQPRYVRRAPRVSRSRRAEPVFAPRRAYIVRPRPTDRAREVSLPRARLLRVRHASLPVPVKEQASSSREKKKPVSLPLASQDKGQSAKPEKTVTREPDGDPVSKALNDPTLRRGDIVVLAGGAKVFKGARASPHQLSDFDDVRSSKLLGDKTRRALMAMRLQTAPTHAQAEPATAARDQSTDQAPGDEHQQVAVVRSVPRRVGP